MPLIKDGEVVDDPWTVVADDAPLPDGPAVISLARWLADADSLRGDNRPLGLLLKSKEAPDALAADLGRFDLICLEFPRFQDGRAYSYARKLRQRHGFAGELRAVGNVLRDQFLFMRRCGFDAFEVADAAAVDAWRRAVAEISVAYQPAADDLTPVQALRHPARG
jgi:uncharacterized protein (DUF934 family)